MPRSQDVVHIHGNYLGETSKACKFEVLEIGNSGATVPEGTDPIQWFPFSQVDSIRKNATDGTMDSLTVSAWILKQKELLE